MFGALKVTSASSKRPEVGMDALGFGSYGECCTGIHFLGVGSNSSAPFVAWSGDRPVDGAPMLEGSVELHVSILGALEGNRCGRYVHGVTGHVITQGTMAIYCLLVWFA